VLVGALAAWLGWEMLSFHYGREAQKFDLAQMNDMEAASVIYDRTGKQIGKIFIQNRNPVKWEDISPNMVEAVIAAEDNEFYRHNGVDWAGIMRAALANYRHGRITQGASTVTQQLARNSFELRERTYQRKLIEIFLAMEIEQKFSKEEIMTSYLNRVYFGSGFYGVEAAARGYFGKSARDLDVGQAAALAGLLKSPQKLSPFNNPDASKEARNFVLKRMRECGFLDGNQYRREVDLPLYVRKRTNPFKVSYAIDYIRQRAIDALGYDRAMNGGLRIHTTLDNTLQLTTERSIRKHLAEVEARSAYPHETFEAFRKRVKSIEEAIDRGRMGVKMPRPKYLQTAVLAVDSATGGILTMVGGREFKHSEYNRATQARRPAGTTFTPFVFATAYEQGIFPGELVEDACIDNRYVMVGGESGILGEWGVERPDNEYEGKIPLSEALARGKNAATVRVGFRTGLEAVKKLARDAGISSPLRKYSNTFLGSSEVTLEELTLAFTPFGAGGWRPKGTFIIDRITDADDKLVYKTMVEKVQAMSPEAAYQVHRGLVDALHNGTGRVAHEYGLKGIPTAGKTGTAYNFTDTYFVGYNSSVTCGVWVGFDRPTRIFRGAFGKDLALPIWVDIINTASSSLPALEFPRPDLLEEVEICRDSGLLAAPTCKKEVFNPNLGRTVEVSTTVLEYATEKQRPKVLCDIHGAGIRHYARQYEQEEWPRAASAVDLTRVRPVAINSPSLIGLTDVYGSVRPGFAATNGEVPIARAVAVNDVVEYQPPLTMPETVPLPAAPVVTEVAAPTAQAAPMEVRRAEAARPDAGTLLESPAISAPTPEPIRF